MEPADKLKPGTELKFVAEGTPGAKATFTIENVAANLPMRETAPARYEGSCTLKRLDKVTGGVPVVATLEGNGQTIRSNLTRNQMLVDSRPPTIKNQQPRDGETVLATGPVSVSGTFDDAGGLGVDPKSVKITLSGRDVTGQSSYNERITADADGNFAFDIAPQMLVPGMRYEVNLKASANNQTKDTKLVLFQQRG
jgi:hypothetical protein